MGLLSRDDRKALPLLLLFVLKDTEKILVFSYFFHPAENKSYSITCVYCRHERYDKNCTTLATPPNAKNNILYLGTSTSPLLNEMMGGWGEKRERTFACVEVIYICTHTLPNCIYTSGKINNGIECTRRPRRYVVRRLGKLLYRVGTWFALCTYSPRRRPMKERTSNQGKIS